MELTDRRSLGLSGVDISRIGLGGYELGPEPGEEPDVDRAERVIKTAIANGVNWLDTSENYLETRNESVIGPALGAHRGRLPNRVEGRPGRRGDRRRSGFRREQVLQACRDSLTRLGRDHLDIYFTHWPDDSGVPLEETWGAMAELEDAGLVRAIGLSNYRLEDVERCHAARRVDAVQVGLNLIDHLDDRAASPGAVNWDRGHDLRAARERCARWEDARPGARGLGRPLGRRRVLQAPLSRGRAGDGAARQRPPRDRRATRATLAQLAIAWVLHQPGVTAAIAGSRDAGHMKRMRAPQP